MQKGNVSGVWFKGMFRVLLLLPSDQVRCEEHDVRSGSSPWALLDGRGALPRAYVDQRGSPMQSCKNEKGRR